MKYAIDNSTPKAEVLKGYKLVRDGQNIQRIEATFLDGSKDLYDYNEKTVDNLDDRLYNQMIDYTRSSKKKISSNKLAAIWNAIVAIPAGIYAAYNITNLNVTNNMRELLFTAALTVVSVVSASFAIESFNRYKDLKKYETYKLNQEDLSIGYHEIVTKEKELKGRANNDAILDLNNIDKVSENELQKRLIKVRRYNELKG